MPEESSTPGPATERSEHQRDLDGEVERLARRIAEVVNSAGPDARVDLREYAIGLLKEETELNDVTAEPSQTTDAPRFNLLAIALLLVLVSLPLLLSVVFAPVGLAVLVIAGIMGVWGLATVVLGR